MCNKRIELITSFILISSDRDSSIMLPGSCKATAVPACYSMNLNASHIIPNVSFLSPAIVIIANTPDYKQSCNINAVPFLDSRSKEIDYSLHMWKNALYYILEIPGWCRYLQYMKLLYSEKSRLCSTVLPVRAVPLFGVLFSEEFWDLLWLPCDMLKLSSSSPPRELASFVLSPPTMLLLELFIVYFPVSWSIFPS